MGLVGIVVRTGQMGCAFDGEDLIDNSPYRIIVDSVIGDHIVESFYVKVVGG